MQKYPRTQHIAGSRLQKGDQDLAAIPRGELAGCHLVIEEKLDGANSAVSFGPDGGLLLQSRGHYLRGGPRERHFALLKTWASCHQTALREVLGARYVMYGEWLYARHTIFYDALPHYFMEFDVFDRETGTWLSTPRRASLLTGLPVASVPILHSGPLGPRASLQEMVRHSLYKSRSWRGALDEAVQMLPDPALGLRETDPSDLAEGLYVKVEADGCVQRRLKWVRASFLQAVAESGSHWLDRPILPNRLAPGVDIYVS